MSSEDSEYLKLLLQRIKDGASARRSFEVVHEALTVVLAEMARIIEESE